MIVKLLQWLRRGITRGSWRLAPANMALLSTAGGGAGWTSPPRIAALPPSPSKAPDPFTHRAVSSPIESDFAFIKDSQSVHVLSLLSGEGLDLSALSETVSVGLDSSFEER